jgi:3-oxoacyl-[acyl-carrier protein] reductase
MSTLLAGKTAVITGASRGIGRALCKGFSQEGAVVYCAARSEAELSTLVHEINSSGNKAVAVKTDITNEQDVKKLFEKASADSGRIDILIVNAGGNPYPAEVEHSDSSEWIQTITLNLTGAYICAKLAIPYLRASGSGKIIMMGSGIGHRGRIGNSAYACAKSGVWMLTRVLSEELWEDGISVNELIPGPVNTPGANQSWAQEKNPVNAIDSEWVKEPEDVVPLALFMAAQPNTGSTAQTFSMMRRDL